MTHGETHIPRSWLENANTPIHRLLTFVFFLQSPPNRNRENRLPALEEYQTCSRGSDFSALLRNKNMAARTTIAAINIKTREFSSYSLRTRLASIVLTNPLWTYGVHDLVFSLRGKKKNTKKF